MVWQISESNQSSLLHEGTTVYRVEEGDFPDFLACRDLEDFNTFRYILVQARYLPLRIEDSLEIPLSELIPNEETQRREKNLRVERGISG